MQQQSPIRDMVAASEALTALGKVTEAFIQSQPEQGRLDAFNEVASSLRNLIQPDPNAPEIPNLPSVLVAMPRGYMGVHPMSARAGYTNCTEDKVQIFLYDIASESLLARGFNEAMCHYLNSGKRYDYFCMLHSDVVPHGPWVDLLMEELHKIGGVGVMHAVIPIKDNRGLTSTAFGNSQDPWDNRRRIVMRELTQFPHDTFTFEDLKEMYGKLPPNPCLLPNTGCMLMRGDWIEQFAQEHAFTIKDRIEHDGKGYRYNTISEDWGLGYWCAQNGIPVGGTRRIKVEHYGTTGHPNYGEWGIWEKDDSFFKDDPDEAPESILDVE